MDDIMTLSEEDIKRRYITPALESKGWTGNRISMEHQLTDGRIVFYGQQTRRAHAKRADYVLWDESHTIALAVVEAKTATRGVSHGIQQAIDYATMLHAPFAYSSNGTAFHERDLLTGRERTFDLDDFPTCDELAERYRSEAQLTPEQERAIRQPFCEQQNVYPPRYYQRASVNIAFDAIARGQKRLLLVMATGTGKTYIAFQLVWRLIHAGFVRKVLYLADRNILVDQSIQQDFKPLKAETHKVNYTADNKDQAIYRSYQVYFALYQQLAGQKEDKERYRELFARDYFDLVIVDECHRGSAKQDSTWRKILEYFAPAIHLGMTATPKETKYQSNIAYFGEPLYTYSLNQGILDGFLAPFRVINLRLNISDGWRPTKGQLDVKGHEIPDRIYNNSDYDYSLVLEDRTREVARQITQYLRATDRMAKTIVFCADEDHAERMRVALVNENADLCRKHHNYVVRITGSDLYGKSQLDSFISPQPLPVIATTSRLLSTGVDTKTVRLIVLDKQISSLIEFKQIVGRGTRILEKHGKTHFHIMDLRGVSRLFADPDWDGPIEPDPDYPPSDHIVHDPTPKPDPAVPQPPTPRGEKLYVGADGCRVRIIDKIVSIYDAQGKLLTTESITTYARKTLTEEFQTLNALRLRWQADGGRQEILDALATRGVDLDLLKIQEGKADVDDFDFLCYLAFHRPTLSRRERADAVKKRDLFTRYGETAREVLDKLLDKYAKGGIQELDDIRLLLQNDPFKQMGSIEKIASRFGGPQPFLQALGELKTHLYDPS